jgi:uridine kinase
MVAKGLTIHPNEFSSELYPILQRINRGLDDLEPYEFSYGLDNVAPEKGWETIEPIAYAEIERMIAAREFYTGIQLKPRVANSIVIDQTILNLTRMLFVGLVSGVYSEDWVKLHFYFDIRSFVFFCRIDFFNQEILHHFGGSPYRQFEIRQHRFESFQEIGYKDFKAANAEIDAAFIDSLLKLVRIKGTPILLTIAGPTAAGKTEIGERLLLAFANQGKQIAVIEMDNFLFDRDIREGKPMGRETTHVDLFKACMLDLLQGKQTIIPYYDSVNARSSHDRQGNLRQGRQPLVVEPADIIFVEGNFPFHMTEIADLVGIKIAYLTTDSVRLKRKWKRDVDYRKKYDPNYFVNRFFATQFLRAQDTYLPQLVTCDLAVDTTAAALWAVPKIASLLDRT